MPGLDEFAEIIKPNEPLAPYTYFKLGGPAEALMQPRTRAELAALVRRCHEDRIPLHVLGGGCNLLVREEGVRGVVLRLTGPTFTEVRVEGKRVQSGTGVLAVRADFQAARNNLAGFESLVGVPGTVGGALRCNAGDRSGEISQYVRRVEVMDENGEVEVRERDELRFDYRWSNLDDPVLLSADFELDTDDADAIVKRMCRAWIQRKASQPLSFQAAGRIFKNPRGLNAASLIEQAGLAKTRVGGAEVSDRNANFIVAHAGATPRDVLRLIDLVRARIRERFSVELELEIAVW